MDSKASNPSMTSNRVVPHCQIKRPDAREYHGGYEEEPVQGYATAERATAGT